MAATKRFALFITLLPILFARTVFAQGSAISSEAGTLRLDDNLFWLAVVTVVACTTVLCTVIIAFRNNTRLLNSLLKHDYTILRLLTVLFVIWATVGLTTINGMNDGVYALFGSIIGYVFGSMKNGTSNNEKEKETF
jgi:hypothetical protein